MCVYTVKSFQPDRRCKAGRRLIHQQAYPQTSLDREGISSREQFEQWMTETHQGSGWTFEIYDGVIPLTGY